MKCLVVDPSDLMRLILVRALRAMGVENVVEAHNGTEALERSAGADLVITEWAMPRVGGLELLKRLRANTETANIPVLLVTSRNTRRDVLEARDAGVNGYLLKPVSPRMLRKKVGELVPPLAEPTSEAANGG